MTRNTHDRSLDHHGTELASAVVLDGDTSYTYSDGDDLYGVVDSLDSRLAVFEGLVRFGTADPTAGGGVAHTMPAIYIRNNSGVTEIWIATGTGPTDWTEQTSP